MFKKISVLAAASVAALTLGSAYAGGPDYQDQVPFTYSGVYIEGTLGYAIRDWSTVFNSNIAGLDTSNLHGGFSGGFDVGYQFNEYFAIEGGWLYLPQYQETLAGTTDKLRSWAAYGGFKMMAPLYRNLFVFGKLAAAYNNLTASNANGAAAANNSATYWVPMFGAGLQYYFNQNISIHFQYIHLPGRSQINTASGRTPNADLFLVGAGYKFAI